MFELTDYAKSILEKRYFLKDVNGNVLEDWTDLCNRVVNAVLKDEMELPENFHDKYGTKEEIFNMLHDGLFLPNSPTLMNAGKPDGQLSACFVLPIEDSMEDIFDSLKNAALIHKSGGGTGFDFSKLRAKGSKVKTTGGVASGPISFLKVYNAATEAVKQGGTRRGANMGVLRVDHPDILEFITCKKDNADITNFNLSVGVTLLFMQHLESESLQPFTDNHDIPAQVIWDALVEGAWLNGDPGIVFIDIINRKNPTPELGRIESTNPCVHGDTLISTTMGEIPVRDLTKYKQVDVYTRNMFGDLEIQPAVFFGTKTKAKLIKVITSKSEILCTPDHKFLTKNGWTEAKDLKPRQLLIGLNRHKCDETQVEVTLSGSKMHKKESRLIMEYYFGNLQGIDVHHKDGNDYNNKMDNLQALPHWIHSIISNVNHTEFASKSSETGQFQKKATKKKRYLSPIQGTTGVNWRVLSIEDGGYAPVFDGNVNGTHCYIANGVVVHNCGEIPLLPYEACNLGSINLSSMDISGDEQLRHVVRMAVRFLDCVIDASVFPLLEIHNAVSHTRKLGLGIMGFADHLIQMDIRYDSPEALCEAERIMKLIQETALEASTELGRIKGFSPYCNMYKSRINSRRNATVTGIAPTGTLSQILGCSSGIEPLFGLVETRTQADMVTTIVNEDFIGDLKFNCVPNIALILEEVKKTGSCQHIEEIPKEIRNLYVTAHDISPDFHVEMQAAFQKYTCNAVSKTINLPHTATKEDVDRVLRLAYSLGCKGITVYRDNSREGQTIQTTHTQHTEEKHNPSIKVAPRERPETTEGNTTKVKVACGNLYVTINSDGEGICEVFTHNGREGGCNAQSEEISRLISLGLRCGVPVEFIIEQLKGLRCPACRKEGITVLSCPDAIGRLLEKAQKEQSVLENYSEIMDLLPNVETIIQNIPKCTECGQPTRPEGGCHVCIGCGFQKCGG